MEQIEIDMSVVTEKYHSGMTIQEVADEIGVSYGTLRQRLIDQGVTIRDAGVSGGKGYRKGQALLNNIEKNMLARLYLAGYTTRQLGERFGITAKRAEKYLAKMGIRKTK